VGHFSHNIIVYKSTCNKKVRKLYY